MEQTPKEPNPEQIETEIKEFQRILYENWAGESFDRLPPDLQEEFLDVDSEAECGMDREAAKQKLEAFIKKLRESKS